MSELKQVAFKAFDDENNIKKQLVDLGVDMPTELQPDMPADYQSLYLGECVGYGSGTYYICCLPYYLHERWWANLSPDYQEALTGTGGSVVPLRDIERNRNQDYEDLIMKLIEVLGHLETDCDAIERSEKSSDRARRMAAGIRLAMGMLRLGPDVMLQQRMFRNPLLYPGVNANQSLTQRENPDAL